MGEIIFERSIAFALFWGVWLLIPIIIDVSTSLVYFINFISQKKKPDQLKKDLDYYPYVTIVIPVHNSATTLYQCLQSIANQSYPLDSLQVICVNNGSEDNSFDVYQKFHYEHREVMVVWNSLDVSGKSVALNAGIYSGQGVYVMNVDADVWLHPDAILNAVKTFEFDPSLVCATGAIRVDKNIVQDSSFIDIINYCEIIEYILAFEVGRNYQNLKNAIFTISGAFSIFRRDIILQSFMYQTRTVSEDTDLTFNIRAGLEKSDGRIGFIKEAVAYVEPIESLYRLYTQRVRWQRGEIEVVGIYYNDNPNFFLAVKDFVGRILISDHTLAFLRLSWTFLLPFLYLLGYHLETLMLAMIGLYVCYQIIEICNFYIAYKGSEELYRKKLKKVWWVIFFMPLYRYLVYWFRLSGIILVFMESGAWKVENPVKQINEAAEEYLGFGKKKSEIIKRWLGI